MSVMSTGRIALYVGGTFLLIAWLASAASAPEQAPGAPAGTAQAVTDAEQLLLEARQRTAALKTRLASRPGPTAASRNPFEFGTAPAVQSAGTRGVTLPTAALPQPVGTAAAPEPALQLIGVAETQGPAGATRTGMLSTGAGDLIVVAAGDVVLGRYRVERVGDHSIDLADTTSGAARRLSLAAHEGR